MDVIQTEAWSAIKQSIARQLIFEATRLGLPPTSHQVVSAVIYYFNGGASLPNQCLCIVVQQIAATTPDPNQ